MFSSLPPTSTHPSYPLQIMQTILTNSPRTHLRSCLRNLRLAWFFVAVGIVATNFSAGTATGQSIQPPNQLPRWEAPEIPQPIASPSNQVRSQIGLATYAEPAVENSNAPIQTPTQVQASTQVRRAAFESVVEIPNSIDEQPATSISNPTDESNAPANNFANPATVNSVAQMFNSQASGATSPEGIWPSIKVGLLLAVLSLAPAIILMTTCYVRVVVVLTLLRQAFGGQQLPPMQVVTALSLFLTLLIMAPVWNEVKTEAIDPYTREQSPISWEEAWERGIEPVKHFMVTQIEASGNADSVAVFYEHLPDAGKPPTTLKQVPINVLLPAFLISELKVAFLLGFQIFLPFLVLDLVVSSVTVSSGMMMLPPTMVSFPLKLILFVMVDGWNLVVGMLLQSFAPM